MNVIALTGLPRVGKDAFADRLVNKHRYFKLGFADPLKGAAAVLLGRPLWQLQGAGNFNREAPMPEWGFSARWFLQVLGTECLRQQVDPDFWVKHMRNRLVGSHYTHVVITDCRFENEAIFVRSLGGIVVEIRRPGSVGSEHPSDAGVKPDIIAYNNGSLDKLHAIADGIVARTDHVQTA